jgi:pSer/pThr/pTyr-binding forkhead associated (FHA) protein
MNRQVAKIELENGISFIINEASLPLLIGRDSSCGICVPLGHISRKHCEPFLVNDVLCLRDISTNGTTVGNRRINGESISIDGCTPVLFAGEVTIKVTPCAMGETQEDRRSDSDRRCDDRRQGERRATATVVDFERRRDQTRGHGERRVACRRSLAATVGKGSPLD